MSEPDKKSGHVLTISLRGQLVVLKQVKFFVDILYLLFLVSVCTAFIPAL